MPKCCSRTFWLWVPATSLDSPRVSPLELARDGDGKNGRSSGDVGVSKVGAKSPSPPPKIAQDSGRIRRLEMDGS